MRLHHAPRLCLPAFVFTAVLASCADSGSDDNANIADSTQGPASSGSPINDESAPVDATLSPGPTAEPPIDGEQTSFYFSYDESTSTAARDLSLFAIENGFRPAPTLGRAFEFLNAESFEPFNSQAASPWNRPMHQRRARI